MADVPITATVRVPRPFAATLYEEPTLVMEMGLVGQVVFAGLPSRVPFWLISSDPPVTPPLPSRVMAPTIPNLPPPTAAAEFWMEEAPKAKLPFSVAFEKEPVCLRITPVVNGQAVSKAITRPVEATPEELLPGEEREFWGPAEGVM